MHLRFSTWKLCKLQNLILLGFFVEYLSHETRICIRMHPPQIWWNWSCKVQADIKIPRKTHTYTHRCCLDRQEKARDSFLKLQNSINVTSMSEVELFCEERNKNFRRHWCLSLCISFSFINLLWQWAQTPGGGPTKFGDAPSPVPVGGAIGLQSCNGNGPHFIAWGMVDQHSGIHAHFIRRSKCFNSQRAAMLVGIEHVHVSHCPSETFFLRCDIPLELVQRHVVVEVPRIHIHHVSELSKLISVRIRMFPWLPNMRYLSWIQQLMLWWGCNLWLWGY